ncbi:MAG: beta-ketoacyl-[acyl-carrier-protein] synthase family protein, partial [Cypionkella sp.]
MRRVVITGAGTVNALGHSVGQTYAALAAGRGAIGALDILEADRLASPIGAQVRGWQPSAQFSARELAMLDPFAQFALASARQAMVQAGLDLVPQIASAVAQRAGVVLGTAGGGLTTTNDAYRAVYSQGKNRVAPLTVPRLMASAAASHISMALGLMGPSFAVSSACASSNHAMGLAVQMLRAGAADIMLAGGSEAMLSFGGLKAWEALRVMSPDGCRPFCATRNGMVQGEGGAVFVFEDMDHARARGAPVLAEVLGFAMTSDAADLVMPSQTGAERAMAGALADAGLGIGDVDYINAHGTGTAANDRVETAAIRTVFGAQANRLAVSSTKSMHGHLIGGAGAVELLACLMALQDGVIAPTIGYTAPDTECDLDIVPNTARRAAVRVAMSNAFAFGGMNASIILG